MHRADHSSRGLLLSVACLNGCVIVKSRERGRQLPENGSKVPHEKIFIAKGKFHSRTDREGQEEEYSYSSNLSLTSTLDRVGWSAPRPGRYTPETMTRYPLNSGLGVFQSSGQMHRSIILHVMGTERRQLSK
jgi:hypothetical protein